MQVFVGFNFVFEGFERFLQVLDICFGLQLVFVGCLYGSAVFALVLHWFRIGSQQVSVRFLKYFDGFCMGSRSVICRSGNGFILF